MGIQSLDNSLGNFPLGLYVKNPPVPPAADTLLANMIWYYKLEEIVNTSRLDSSVNQLTLAQGGTVGSNAGAIEQAAGFNGATINKLSGLFSSAYNLSATDFSITGWVYLTNITSPKTFFYIGTAAEATAEVCIAINYNNTGNIINFKTSNGGFITDSDVVATGIQADKWHFVACRYNSTTDDLEIRFDGNIATAPSVQAPQSQGTQSFVLGNQVTDSANVMNGRLDEWGGWDRYITDDEIAYLAGPGRPNLLTFLEIDGNMVHDDAGNVLAFK